MISFTHISHLSSAFENWYSVGLTFFLILSETTLPPFCGNTPTIARSSFLDKFPVWRPPLPPDRSSRTSKLPTTDGARTSHHILNPSKQITAYEASQHFKCAHHLVDMIHFSFDCLFCIYPPETLHVQAYINDGLLWLVSAFFVIAHRKIPPLDSCGNNLFYQSTRSSWTHWGHPILNPHCNRYLHHF